MLEDQVLSSGRLLIVGDFNFPMQDVAHPDVIRMQDLLDTFALKQHVTEATHINGGLLDLVMSRECDELISGSPLQSPFSDHNAILSELHIRKPPLPRNITFSRNWKRINMDTLLMDLEKSPLFVSPSTEITAFLTQLNDCINNVVDKHAPIRKKCTVIRPYTPWFNGDIANAKKEKRKAESTWRRTRSEVSRQIFCEKKNKVVHLIKKAKIEYYNNSLTECSDQKQIFQILNKLLHKAHCSALPTHTLKEEISSVFRAFFDTKIQTLRTDIDKRGIEQNIGAPQSKPQVQCKFTKFTPLTMAEVKKLVIASPTKSCSLDPLPTWLLKEHIDFFLPPITTLVNMSLTMGIVPQDMKVAHVSPLLKKSTLDCEKLKNYRPVSNLSFLSKLIERAVDKQLSKYMDENELHAATQSAYRPNHSTETCLLKINNDLLQAMDRKNATMLVLLDLSAAFDTIDHDLLLKEINQH